MRTHWASALGVAAAVALGAGAAHAGKVKHAIVAKVDPSANGNYKDLNKSTLTVTFHVIDKDVGFDQFIDQTFNNFAPQKGSSEVKVYTEELCHDLKTGTVTSEITKMSGTLSNGAKGVPGTPVDGEKEDPKNPPQPDPNRPRQENIFDAGTSGEKSGDFGGRKSKYRETGASTNGKSTLAVRVRIWTVPCIDSDKSVPVTGGDGGVKEQPRAGTEQLRECRDGVFHNVTQQIWELPDGTPAGRSEIGDDATDESCGAPPAAATPGGKLGLGVHFELGGAFGLKDEPNSALIGFRLSYGVTPNKAGMILFQPEVMTEGHFTTVALQVGFEYDFALPVQGLYAYPWAAIGYAASIFSVGGETVTGHSGIASFGGGVKYILNHRWSFAFEPVGFSVFFSGNGASAVYRLAALAGILF